MQTRRILLQNRLIQLQNRRIQLQNRRIKLQTGRIQLQYRRIQLQTGRTQSQRRRIQLQKPVINVKYLMKTYIAQQLNIGMFPTRSCSRTLNACLLVFHKCCKIEAIAIFTRSFPRLHMVYS